MGRFLPSNPASSTAKQAFRIGSAVTVTQIGGKQSKGKRGKGKGNKNGTNWKALFWWGVAFLIMVAFFHP
jgi:hypothetical protein